MPEASQELGAYQASLQFFHYLKRREPAETEPLTEALFAAAQYHGNQRRKNGLLYLTHPIQVASILLKEGGDLPTVIAGLLHDVLEDTAATPEEIEQRFGVEVLKLVEGATNSKIFSKRENLEKTYNKSRQDPRIAWIKLADRCTNLMNHSALALSPQSHLDNLQETEEFHLGQLATIPSIPTDLTKQLRHYLAESREDYRKRSH